MHKKKKSVKQLVHEQFQKVETELRKPDLNYAKFRCPICRGYGGAKGQLAGVALSANKIGKCRYCGGSGVARRRKRR
jgi:hypothetical protein